MPDPYERHARTGDLSSWHDNPARKQSRAAAAADDTVKRPPGKKDKSLCKAAHWKGPHAPELRVRQYVRWEAKCSWGVDWGSKGPAWHCMHEEFCTGCGKVLRSWIADGECPQYKPLTEEQRTAIALEIEQRQLRWRARRRPVIDGPQGYRKPKENTDVQG